jgi:hypothetical protein
MTGWVSAKADPPGAGAYLIFETLTDAVRIAYFTKARGWEDDSVGEIDSWVTHWQYLPDRPADEATGVL